MREPLIKRPSWDRVGAQSQFTPASQHCIFSKAGLPPERYYATLDGTSPQATRSCPNMRTKSLTGLVPSRTSEQAPTVLLQDPDRWWYLHELARHMQRPPPGLRKALIALAGFGILRT